MKTNNKISLVIALSMLSMLVWSSTIANAPDISGTYTCTGQDPLSTPPEFSEKLILKSNGDTYSVKAISTNSVIPWGLGTAIFKKDVNNAFAYVYWNLKDPTSFGSELFIIKPDGSLDGVFSDNNKNKPATETCTKAS